MNPDEFRAPAGGKIVFGPRGYAAFVPAPLPPTIEYDTALVLALSRADAALGELEGLGRNLPNPHLLISPYIRREAVLSSRIEGTQTTVAGLLRDEVEEPFGSGDGDLREVRNYVSSLEYGIAELHQLSLSLRMVRHLHRLLLTGVRGHELTPGEFRRVQNVVGPPGSNEFTAPYVPPPAAYLDDCLRDWERFVHQRDVMPDLIQCALIHEQFEAIHPFNDGNGRLGRLLIVLFLLDRGRLSQPLFYPSAYIEQYRDAYYDALQRVRTVGDWRGWLLFFLAGVRQTASAAVRQASQLTDLREEYRTRLRDNPRALILLDALFNNPYMTFPRAMRELQVSNPTARRAVAQLRELNMLTPIGNQRYKRLFAALPVLRLIAPEEVFTSTEQVTP